MPTLPLVSILIPAYNPRYFQEALLSAQAQTYANIEIIVCDDSSDQQIANAATAVGQRLVRYERNPERLHGRGNFNKCLSLARGDYIKFLNDDDRLAPDCVAKLVAPLIRDPELVLATSKRRRINGAGTPLPDSESTLAPVDADSRLQGASVCRAILTSMSNFIGEPSTVLVRRSALPPTGTDVMSYRGEPIRYLADVAMWFNALSHGDAVYLIEPLSDFRVHEEQHQQTEDAARLVLPNYRLLCRQAQEQGLLINADGVNELVRRPRMIPGWAELRHRPLAGGDWRDSILYFGPERIAHGATTALLNAGGFTELTDYFLLEAQFDGQPNSRLESNYPERSTRQCTRLWTQLLVECSGDARPCPRYEKTHNIYAPPTSDSLAAARFAFLIGRPQGPCTECNLFPLVHLQNFVQHNFSGQKNLLSPHSARVLVPSDEEMPTRPAHVLVVGHSAGRAGGEFVALTLVRGLQERGIHVTLILARGGALEEEFRRYADVYLVGRELNDTNTIKTLLAKLRMDGVQHAICNTASVGRYAVWLKELGYQVVHLIHELSSSIEHFLPNEDQQGVCVGPDTIIFPARFVETSFLDHYAPRSLKLLRHAQGIEPDFERPADRTPLRNGLRMKLGLPLDARLVIGAGSGELRKGADLFLQVAQRVLADPTDQKTHFIWLGQLEASLTSWLEHDCRILGITERFHLAGLQADMKDFYLGADVFLMTSREDPLPNVVIESMYAGLPVVAFAGGGGTPELLEDGCGCVVPYLDVDAMASTTRYLLDAPTEAVDIATRAAAKIDLGFRRKDYVDLLLNQFWIATTSVALVLPGSDLKQLGRQLDSLAAALMPSGWRPDKLILPCAPRSLPIPPSLGNLPCCHLDLPATSSAQEQLRQATHQAQTELIWYLDTPIKRLETQFFSSLTTFAAPRVVIAGGPGHDPASAESLPSVLRALLTVNERHWLQYQWPRAGEASGLERSLPVLSLGSLFLRRSALMQAFITVPNSIAGNPLWFWPLLTTLGRTGTLAWAPQTTALLDMEGLPLPTEAKSWWRWWCDTQATARNVAGATAPTELEAKDDRHRVRDSLGLTASLAPEPAKPKKVDQALNHREELVEYEKACTHLDNGRLEKAEALLTSLAKRGSTLWQVYFDLGRIAFEREQPEAAIGHFKAAASLEFSSTHALRNLIAIYTMIGEYGTALAATGLTLRRESDPDLQAHLQAIVTEANVNLDNLDWASPHWAGERVAAETTRKALEYQLQEAQRTIEQMDRQLLLAQAGSLQRHSGTAGVPLIARPRRPLCIVHIGMPKTGSTAIQTSLGAGIRDNRFAYANLPGISHVEICSMFADAPELYYCNVHQGRRGEAIETYHKNARTALVQGFTEHNCDTEIISCEDIYSLSRQELERLRDFLRLYFEQITVVGYVRPPRSFIASMFQQKVKYFNQNHFNFSTIYHPYRKIEIFEQVFGHEQVRIWKFDPATFPAGDVVQDFCLRLGIAPQGRIGAPVNEALSQEAIAVLFALNRYGNTYRFGEQRFTLMDRLVSKLAGVGQSHFRFADTLMDQVMADYADDVTWIESRLGQSMQENRRNAGIDSEAALLKVAANTVPNILPLLDGRHMPYREHSATPEDAAALLDTLLDQIAAELDFKRN